ncbi:unnamed protein product [Gongylonema pulchrum]|uniref:EGF-like domain-containing protein n=1 Tax=Gongylonema pulchrum TaxID=637853 RepID=A0A3P7MYQ5_9BILA|nr:unnamed protein product [Gongylonema pulchrum]
MGCSKIVSARQPGEWCQYSQQCDAVELGSLCQNERCQCAPGMLRNGHSCSFVDRKCVIRGYVWIPEIGECLQVLQPGAIGCSHSAQCSVAAHGAYCSRHTCTCPEGLVPSDGTCGKQCPAGFTFSSVTGQCIPPDLGDGLDHLYATILSYYVFDHIPRPLAQRRQSSFNLSFYNLFCFAVVRPGEQCFYSTQCEAENAEMICDRSICRCPNNKLFTGATCAENCPPGYMEANGICKQGCDPTQVEHNGRCYDQVAAGQSCVLNSQCTGGTSCVNGFCICPASMTIRGGSCRQSNLFSTSLLVR